MGGILRVLGWLCLAVSGVAAAQESTFGPRLIQEDVRIPAGRYSIAATVLRPEGPGPYGAVVLNHGTPGSASGRARESSELLINAASVFARRGYVVVMPLRRGLLAFTVVRVRARARVLGELTAGRAEAAAQRHHHHVAPAGEDGGGADEEVGRFACSAACRPGRAMVQHDRPVAPDGLGPENRRSEGIGARGDANFFLYQPWTEGRVIRKGCCTGERQTKPDQSPETSHCRFSHTGYFNYTV